MNQVAILSIGDTLQKGNLKKTNNAKSPKAVENPIFNLPSSIKNSDSQRNSLFTEKIIINSEEYEQENKSNVNDQFLTTKNISDDNNLANNEKRKIKK